MQSFVTKWGNSLGIRIPALLAEKAHLQNGTPIEIEFKDEVIMIRRQRYNLEEMLSLVTPENEHEEISTDEPKGNEIW